MILLKVGFSIYVLDFTGGCTRTRALDPLIKSCLIPTSRQMVFRSRNRMTLQPIIEGKTSCQTSGDQHSRARPRARRRGGIVATETDLRCLLLVKKTFDLGASNDSARTDLNGLDPTLANQLIEKRSGDPEIFRGFIYGEAWPERVGIHGRPLVLVTRFPAWAVV